MRIISTYLFISPLYPCVPCEIEGEAKKADDHHRPEQSIYNPEAPVEDVGNAVD